MRIFRQSGQFDLAYMLRELALIVIGVTLALSATSWYEQWSDRQTEQAYLDRIRSSLERDISRFDGFGFIGFLPGTDSGQFASK